MPEHKQKGEIIHWKKEIKNFKESIKTREEEGRGNMKNKDNEMMSIEAMEYIIALVVDNARDAKEQLDAEPNDEFLDGRCMAYWEVLDTIKNQLIVREADLAAFGLDFDIYHELM